MNDDCTNLLVRSAEGPNSQPVSGHSVSLHLGTHLSRSLQGHVVDPLAESVRLDKTATDSSIMSDSKSCADNDRFTYWLTNLLFVSVSSWINLELFIWEELLLETNLGSWIQSEFEGRISSECWHAWDVRLIRRISIVRQADTDARSWMLPSLQCDTLLTLELRHWKPPTCNTILTAMNTWS